VEQEFGQVDILVSNAGYLPSALPIAEQDPEYFWRVDKRERRPRIEYA
jgi:NAD(P)-dependent dehydrogenase (short-subunit alcohol dehydrogenase family)